MGETIDVPAKGTEACEWTFSCIGNSISLETTCYVFHEALSGCFLLCPSKCRGKSCGEGELKRVLVLFPLSEDAI